MHVSKFQCGDRVTIVRAFTDYDGEHCPQGLELVFISQTYFPYEGGYTLTFDTRVIRIAEDVDEHGPIIRNEGQAWFTVARDAAAGAA
jgi:hypothetical protein